MAAPSTTSERACGLPPPSSLSTRVHMRLNRRICTFVNACCTAAQACKGSMTKLAIFAAVARDARLAAKDPHPARLKSRQLGEMNGLAYSAVQPDS